MANTTNLDLVKPLGTDHALISVINGNMDKVDAYAGKVNDSLAGIQDGLAIVAVGDTHAAITSGQFVYVKEHNTLPEGLYTASSNIAANGALSTSNLTADSKGGLNALSDQIVTKVSAVTFTATIAVANGIGEVDVTTMTGYDANKFSRRIGVIINGNFTLDERYTCWGSLRTVGSTIYCSIGATQTGNYNVSMTVIYI